MALQFARLTANDVEPVLGMMAKLHADGHSYFDAARSRGAMEELIAGAEPGGVWTIQMDGELAGYLAVVPGYSLEFGGRFGLLDELFVDARWRGRGVGAAAVEFAAQQCREQGWQALRLEVVDGNERAEALYGRSGFQLDGRKLMSRWIR